ncbi:LexA repressor-like protein [Paenibacillus larvae subsp. larvae]|uniref:LexA repressor-like protein n=1 Tax=Paenibacillus larvae subsp. larvae TaxID=147375 RepID=A0A2L1TZ01_9BACL|nr:hypothetical protein B1222_21115 [Paenibacillus larvae subsp. pulvifaciens]AQZ47990.1 hypothetical protein B5S25_16755 [Paenibacillus larvae subsp. pulvifaciens]AVF25902.1 LexA repressor-like protein [Paenibacillus larvae subsp. larvae]AVF30679.1 LexA repressor-like protein [Paenibacillus larvae subsp. larvae]MBH0343515.1 hypothetical protein [Paenibacillus larvae]
MAPFIFWNLAFYTIIRTQLKNHCNSVNVFVLLGEYYQFYKKIRQGQKEGMRNIYGREVRKEMHSIEVS